ncbi:MBL fold metallo-hydrolase [Nakamurella sp. YIM 132087]|uniref:MBL fold metallo-hydrolase n=1 Tax=Nakamurella alba TaxID=2665158 RepID=A0A7K1FLY6_9ACTN|nr:MBL fold metallo-hydrolase [Nakamurella alba]MTD15118.1 MBL fold metallo-hydrolase [Nakamurella alba]
MTLGDIDAPAPNLRVIEGHHPHRLWEDPDIPTIALYRHADTLYLLDSGVGEAQRAAILTCAAELGPVEEVVLVNSHGHLDHLGNNDVLDEIPAARRRHFLPRDARPALEAESFFSAMYQRGLPYFDYLQGLDIDDDSAASVLRALGAELPEGTAAELLRAGRAAGIGPAIAQLLPAAVIRLLMTNYPPTFPRIDGMTDLEDLGPAVDQNLAGTGWTGWDLGGGAVKVLQSGGHSAGGCVFLIPEHGFLMLADETSTAPIWADSDPRSAARMAGHALALMDAGIIRTVCAGHRPMLPADGDAARAVLSGMVAGEAEFRETVDGTLQRIGPIGIDALYDELVATATPGSSVDVLHRFQFPVFGTFLKLTLLNHCLLQGHVETTGPDGRPVFTVAG